MNGSREGAARWSPRAVAERMASRPGRRIEVALDLAATAWVGYGAARLIGIPPSYGLLLPLVAIALRRLYWVVRRGSSAGIPFGDYLATMSRLWIPHVVLAVLLSVQWVTPRPGALFTLEAALVIAVAFYDVAVIAHLSRLVLGLERRKRSRAAAFSSVAVLGAILLAAFGVLVATKASAIHAEVKDYERGMKAYHDHHYEQALADLDRALEDAPDATRTPKGRSLRHGVLNGKGLVLLALDRPKEAVEAFTAALDLVPDDAHVLTNRGLVETRLGDLDGAEADLDRAIELDPADKHACYERGMVFLERGEPEPALERFRKALAIDPDYAAAKERVEAIEDALKH